MIQMIQTPGETTVEEMMTKTQAEEAKILAEEAVIQMTEVLEGIDLQEVEAQETLAIRTQEDLVVGDLAEEAQDHLEDQEAHHLD